MWDVARAQGDFWKKNPTWMRDYHHGKNAPFHPRGQHPAGGAEHMKPEEFYLAAEAKTKISAFIGKGGLSDVAEEPIGGR
jgi:hypothetical protein